MDDALLGPEDVAIFLRYGRKDVKLVRRLVCGCGGRDSGADEARVEVVPATEGPSTAAGAEDVDDIEPFFCEYAGVCERSILISSS